MELYLVNGAGFFAAGQKTRNICWKFHAPPPAEGAETAAQNTERK